MPEVIAPIDQCITRGADTSIVLADIIRQPVQPGLVGHDAVFLIDESELVGFPVWLAEVPSVHHDRELPPVHGLNEIV